MRAEKEKKETQTVVGSVEGGVVLTLVVAAIDGLHRLHLIELVLIASGHEGSR